LQSDDNAVPGGLYAHHPRPRTKVGAARKSDHNDATDGQRFREQYGNPAGADIDTRTLLAFDADDRWIGKTLPVAAFLLGRERGHVGGSKPVHDRT
jgi:hypothetical protein